MVAHEKRVSDELEWCNVHVAFTGTDEFDEAGVERGIFTLLAGRLEGAGDCQAIAAIAEDNQADRSVNLDVPLLWARLTEVECRGDRGSRDGFER